MSSYGKLLKEHYQELQEILDCISVGIYITDGTGKTLFLNRESEKTGGLTKEEVVGKPMEELIRIGYVTESSALTSIKTKKEKNIIQELGDGGQLYISGVPLIKNDNVELVVCTERDITETIGLKELLKEKEEIAGKYEVELEYLRKQSLTPEDNIVAESFEMKNLVEKTRRIAGIDITVLLTGESGTGKELFANLIYQHSGRSSKPFIKVNCAAIPESLMESEFFGYEKGAFTGADKEGKIGIFELANGGTLFLDEIGELPFQMQSKLLRALQEKEIMRIGGKETVSVDVRIIASTNKNLERATKEGKFREDLFYRLNVMPIEIPPLRKRKEDIPKLAVFFLNKFNQEYRMDKVITADAIQELENYSWPGNVRELQSIIERMMVSLEGRSLNKFQVLKQLGFHGRALPEAGSSTGTLQELLEAFEKSILQDQMAKSKNSAAVARELGVNKSTISRKLKKYGIVE
jgi:PAS domain S-box-containing protein